MGKTRRVVATGRVISEAYFAVNKAIPMNGRERKCLDAADTELSKVGQVVHDMDGAWVVGLANDAKGEAVFSEECIFGVKVALVQLISGVSLGKPVAFGIVRHSLLPAAQAFGILKLVRKETKLDEGDEQLDGLDLEFDDDKPELPLVPPVEAKPAEPEPTEPEKK